MPTEEEVSLYDDGSCTIQPGLRADIMRKQMESKNTLIASGDLYVGTGEFDNTSGTYETKRLPIGNNNTFLGVDNNGNLGYQTVGYAAEAGSAATAASATNATNAINATNATNAGHATTADSAAHAAEADTAAHADYADAAPIKCSQQGLTYTWGQFNTVKTLEINVSSCEKGKAIVINFEQAAPSPTTGMRYIRLLIKGSSDQRVSGLICDQSSFTSSSKARLKPLYNQEVSSSFEVYTFEGTSVQPQFEDIRSANICGILFIE